MPFWCYPAGRIIMCYATYLASTLFGKRISAPYDESGIIPFQFEIIRMFLWNVQYSSSVYNGISHRYSKAACYLTYKPISSSNGNIAVSKSFSNYHLHTKRMTWTQQFLSPYSSLFTFVATENRTLNSAPTNQSQSDYPKWLYINFHIIGNVGKLYCI